MTLVAAPTNESNWLSLLVAKGSNSKQLFVSGLCLLLFVTYNMYVCNFYSDSELMEMYGCMYSIRDTN